MAFLLESRTTLTSLEPSRRRLVVSVIEEYHGPIVATVAETLMRTEKTTLTELTRLVQRDQSTMTVSRAGKPKPKVTATHVRESLLILTQHNMLRATMPTEKELRKARAASSSPGNVRLYYSLLPLAVLMRTRGPHFHFHASQKLGKVAGMIVDCLMRHGRRTLPEVKEELLERARQASAKVAMEDGDIQAVNKDGEELTSETIQSTFQALVVGKYIDKVPKLDLDTPSEEPEMARKPAMTFSKIEGPKAASARGKAGATADNGVSKNSELAKRQEKVSAQINARKRRLMGDASHGAEGNGSLQDSDDEDDLPVEMQGVLGMGAGGDYGRTTGRQPPSKRPRRGSDRDRGVKEDETSHKATGRTRGRGRSRGRGARGASNSKGKGKAAGHANGGLGMDGVFVDGGSDDEAGDQGPPRGAGAGAAVLDGVVWKLGLDKFHRDFRHTALLGLVQDRFPKSRLAYLAVKVMLENSAPTERKVDEEVTIPISARVAYDRVCETWVTSALTKNKVVPDWKRFVSWMAALCADLTQMVSKVPGSDLHDPKYVVNMAKMVRYSRSRLVKCTLRDKYGKETARIMEILLQHKYLEQQQVGEMAMIPSSDARERLYRLLKDSLVSMQEVPKRADHNPNTTFYLWTVKHDQVAQVVLDNLYKAMLNLRLRRKFVYSSDKELFIHDAASRVSNEGEKERLEQVRRTLDRLDTALLRLDEHLMFFNTF